MSAAAIGWSVAFVGWYLALRLWGLMKDWQELAEAYRRQADLAMELASEAIEAVDGL